jgi:hypothetical protein
VPFATRCADLLAATNVAVEGQKWYWHLNGRMLQRISDGWPIPRTHRRVIRFCDTITATSEEEARKQIACLYGECDQDNQWSFLRGAEAKPTKRKRR